MKPTAALALILALQLPAAGAQASKHNPKRPAPPEKLRPAAPARRAVVVVDPGHPSEVASGRTPQHGTNETEVAWAVALKLRDALQARGYEVVLTKSREDELVRNRDRAEVANRARASLMVRLHCDASVESGFAVYYPDRPGRSKDGSTGPGRAVIEGSRRAAEALHAAMAEGLGDALADNGVRTDNQTKVGREQGGALTGSIYSEVPVVTVEMVVLSDERDAEFIKAEEGQRRMAESIADGVARFLTTDSPRGKKN